VRASAPVARKDADGDPRGAFAGEAAGDPLGLHPALGDPTAQGERDPRSATGQAVDGRRQPDASREPKRCKRREAERGGSKARSFEKLASQHGRIQAACLARAAGHVQTLFCSSPHSALTVLDHTVSSILRMNLPGSCCVKS
jgi:hypothetical protein